MIIYCDSSYAPSGNFFSVKFNVMDVLKVAKKEHTEKSIVRISNNKVRISIRFLRQTIIFRAFEGFSRLIKDLGFVFFIF
jgi:hypothetical protein